MMAATKQIALLCLLDLYIKTNNKSIAKCKTVELGDGDGAENNEDASALHSSIAVHRSSGSRKACRFILMLALPFQVTVAFRYKHFHN